MIIIITIIYLENTLDVFRSLILYFNIFCMNFTPYSVKVPTSVWIVKFSRSSCLTQIVTNPSFSALANDSLTQSVISARTNLQVFKIFI